MYDVHLVLTVKHVVDFLLVLIVKCYGRGAMSKNRSKISDFAPMQSI